MLGSKVVVTQVNVHLRQFREAKQSLEEPLHSLLLRHTHPVPGQVQSPERTHLNTGVDHETVSDGRGETARADVAAGEVELLQRPMSQETLKVVLHYGVGDEVYVEAKDGNVERWVHGTQIQRQLVVHAGLDTDVVRWYDVVPGLKQHLQRPQVKARFAQQSFEDARLEIHGVKLELLVLVCAVGQGEWRESGQTAVVELDPAQHQALLPRTVGIQERDHYLWHHHFVPKQHSLQNEAVEVWCFKQVSEHVHSVLRLVCHYLLLCQSVDREGQRAQVGNLIEERICDHGIDARQKQVESGCIFKLYPQFFQSPQSSGEDALDHVIAVGHLVLVELCLHDEEHVAHISEYGCHLLDITVSPHLCAKKVSSFELQSSRTVVARLEHNHRHALGDGREG